MNFGPQLATKLTLAIIAAVLAGISLLPRRESPHALLTMLRVLVPSWRFFDDLHESPALLARVAPPGADFGPWRPILIPPARGLASLFFNPAGNLLLAHHSLLERLLADVSAWDDTREPGPESLVTYQLVLNLVRATIAADGGPQLGTRCQFKLVECPSATTNAPGDLLVSREHAP